MYQTHDLTTALADHRARIDHAAAHRLARRDRTRRDRTRWLRLPTLSLRARPAAPQPTAAIAVGN